MGWIVVLQEYVFPDVTDREYLLTMHRLAGKHNLDVNHYNELCDKISEAEYDLRRLRDPLQLHLPIEYLKKLPVENS
jgi:calcium uniporter protein, mitochondrial